MLVLSREVNEEIVIDRSIQVKVLKIGQSQVRLGISAPSGIAIRRAGAQRSDSHERDEQEISSTD